MLGPGCNVSHQAMVLLADSGATAIWTGERGVRFYAAGRSLARSSRLIEAQARLVSNRRSRLRVAREMYAMRFEGEDTTQLTMQQLRGREGARVRRVYRESSDTYGVEWSQREYKPDDFTSSDEINQALSAAHACLYGIVHAAIVGLGCSPALGFVHTGHDLSFVYDVADLYKAEVTIPLAFRTVGEINGTWSSDSEDVPEVELDRTDLPGIVRRRVRDEVKDGKLLSRCVRDIRKLLLPESLTDEEQGEDADILTLWDETSGRVAAGTSYRVDPEGDVDF